MSSGDYMHWCYQCQRPVCLRGRNPVCQYCSGGFVQELSEVFEPGDIGPTLPHEPSDYGFMEPYPDPRNRIMDAFAESIRQRTAGRNPNFDPRRRRSGFVPEHGVVPWFIIDGQGPARTSVNDSRQAPPPATRSAIDSMPTIKISYKHLNTDSHCPVCKDEFELGSEARQMPCNHIYHSGCIEPWLVLHNSCPVCRLQLPAQGTTRGSSSSGYFDRTGNYVEYVANDIEDAWLDSIDADP
ncbi:probable E3 ubiquitin-protein ligase RHC1A, partial [Rutidosis leptorrhynchoides]|uniref:probable E3 ubiquitin-protein ligase RHC1A n=1 Tax=Rutidosis leptorrhynchoides TaxID=125765 RepID=UPI003A99784D